MANKTPNRTIRIPDDEWTTAKMVALSRRESLTDVIRKALRNYVRRNKES